MSKRKSTYRHSRANPRAVVGAAVLTAGILGGVAGAKIDDAFEHRGEVAAANTAEPSCDVLVRPGDNPTIIRQRLSNEGDSGDQMSVVTSDGIVRTPVNTPRYMIDGSMGMEPGDAARVEHVDPAVCQAVGGAVLNAPVDETTVASR